MELEVVGLTLVLCGGTYGLYWLIDRLRGPK